jgi:hypothetical protein
MSSNGNRQSALARLRSIFSEPIHPYRPATTIFLDLNVDRMADDMRLAERGEGTRQSEPSRFRCTNNGRHRASNSRTGDGA